MKEKLVTATAVLLLASACGSGTSDADVEHEKLIACYNKQGQFVEYDDDCHDDGLFTAPPKPVTVAPPKPVTTTKAKTPTTTRTRR